MMVSPFYFVIIFPHIFVVFTDAATSAAIQHKLDNYKEYRKRVEGASNRVQKALAEVCSPLSICLIK